MLLSIALVIIAIWLNIRWAICFWMILGGFARYCIISLIALAIAKCVLQKKVWAIIVITFLYFLIPVGIAVYVAGLLTLVIKVLKAGFSAIF
ncbi:hypothetical protein ES703_70608 [subsurface metagenome]